MGNYLHTFILEKKTSHTGVDPGKLSERTHTFSNSTCALSRLKLAIYITMLIKILILNELDCDNDLMPNGELITVYF